MKIRSLLVMKDEADVIGETIARALAWSDQIVVLDNGSTDGSVEIVRALAEADPRVVPIGTIERPFTDGMRVHCFRAVADQARPGDWWCRLDADEIYAEDPRIVLAEVPADAFSVWSAELTYYFTERDLAAFEADPDLFADGSPVEAKCRYYLNHSSEPRFFRHEAHLPWREEDSGFPPALWRRPFAERRILVKNFRYRSPEQIQRRLDARRGIPFAEFSHERIADWAAAVGRIRETGSLAGEPAEAIPLAWTERVAPSEALDEDLDNGVYVLHPELMPDFPPRLAWTTYAMRFARARLRAYAPERVRAAARTLRGRTGAAITEGAR